MDRLPCFSHFFLLCILSATAEDVDLLISFKNSLPNPALLSNWNHTNNVCEFQGIVCKGGHVSSLTIRGLPLGANFSSVSAHILSLENLQALSLHSTNLTGTISALPLKCSTRLAELDLSGNNLDGTVYVAASLAASCPSLQSINLSKNYIGHVFNNSTPAFSNFLQSSVLRLKILDLSYNKIATDEDVKWVFSKLEQLKHLDLSNNNIKGTMSQIANCTYLQYLDLSFNQLSGKVPADTFSSCLNLTYLNLSSNYFIGKAPPDIKACTGLTTLSLANNNFSGEFPIIALVAMPALQHIDLAFNNFNGSLPKSISNLTSLESLDLSANRFSGPIPSTLCTSNVSNLKVLYLQDNYFTGYIPNSLSNCTSLVLLDLSLNLLYGSIPHSLGSLSNLMDLIMWQNNLHGEIPAELSSIRSLRALLLDYNNLTGTIPDELVNCTNLVWISLSDNRLTGSIPNWIGKLEKLKALLLGNNSFIGSIPPELGDCKSLIYLDLNNNQLNGSIPSSLRKHSGNIVVNQSSADTTDWLYVLLTNTGFTRCNNFGSFLEFDGIRESDLMRLPSTPYCNFSIFLIGHTLQYTRNHTSLVHVDLSYNQLEGHIPIEITTLQDLANLILRHNHLSGPLPQEIGIMDNLASLDLSYNNLEGRIPSSFSALSLGELDLSNNLLSGPIPTGGSFITFSADSFANNSGLCGLPLPPCDEASTPNTKVAQQSSTDHGSSWEWWIVFWLSFSPFFIIGFVIGIILWDRSPYVYWMHYLSQILC